MELTSKIALLLLLVKLGMADKEEESLSNKCATKCKRTNDTCVSYTCYRSAVTTRCNIYSSYLVNTDNHAATCISPEEVNGLPEFCRSILEKTDTPRVENILIERSTIGNEDKEAARNVTYLEDRCLSATVLASVASGAFAAGCFVMWLIMVLLRCLRPCQTEKVNDSSAQTGSRQDSTNSIHASRVSRSRLTDLRSPSSASVDSGLSSTQVTTPSHIIQDQRRPGTANGSLFTFNSTRLPGAKGDNFNRYAATQDDGVYAPSSECSYRDYQSIQGSVYAPSSEGGNSDYSSHPTHRVLFIRENGEIYHPSSESSGNDYTSLKGNHGNIFGIYYPTSDSSCKDYTSLLDESELATGYCDVEDMLVDDGDHDNVKFRVSGFVIPKQKLSTKVRPAPALENVNEYEVLNCHDDPAMANDYIRPVDDISGNATDMRDDRAAASAATNRRLPMDGFHLSIDDISGNATDMRDDRAAAAAATNRRLPMDGFHLSELARSSLQRNSLPHQYIALEPDSKMDPSGN